MLDVEMSKDGLKDSMSNPAKKRSPYGKRQSEIDGKQLKFNLNKKCKEIKNDHYKRKDYPTEVILKSVNLRT